MLLSVCRLTVRSSWRLFRGWKLSRALPLVRRLVVPPRPMLPSVPNRYVWLWRPMSANGLLLLLPLPLPMLSSSARISRRFGQSVCLDEADFFLEVPPPFPGYELPHADNIPVGNTITWGSTKFDTKLMVHQAVSWQPVWMRPKATFPQRVPVVRMMGKRTFSLFIDQQTTRTNMLCTFHTP